MKLGEVLIFDTETTGVPGKGMPWDTAFGDYPHIVQIAWMRAGTREVESHIIYPDDWTVPDDAERVHGISTERAIVEGEPWEDVCRAFLSACEGARMICGHNIHFDTGMVKANILRSFGWAWYDAAGVEDLLYKGRRIDTMRASAGWVDARTADGREKFPRMEELYARCFPGESFPAHDAGADVRAVDRCLPVLVGRGLVKLEIKDYPGEVPRLFGHA